MRESPNLGLHLTTDEDRALNVAQWVNSQTGEGDSNMMKLDTALGGHLADTGNPHGVNAEQVGADPEGSAAAVQGNLDDHASDKSIHPSAEDVEATATVLSRHLGTPALHVGDEERTLWNAGAQIADSAHAIAQAAQTTATAAIPATQKGAAGGVAELDSTGKVPSGQLPAMEYDPAGSAAAVQGNLDSHGANTTLHPSAAKQAEWDAAGAKYGTCDTAAETAAKVATLSGFVRSTGSTVSIAFTHANTTASPTLNVNGTGAASILDYRTNTYPETGAMVAGTHLFIFNGTGWVLLNPFVEAAGTITLTIAPPDTPHTTLTSLSVARTWFAAATDGNGRVLFGGGIYNDEISVSVVDCYNVSGTRTSLTALSAARFTLAAATDGSGRVLFGGGANINGDIAVVDCYNASGTRTTLTALSVARSGSGAATDGSGRVLFGGGYSVDNRSAIVDCYTASGTRTTLASLSIARYEPAAATDGNGRVLFGGGSTGGYSAVVDCYDVSGTHATLTSLSVARDNLAAATDGNGRVLFGGGSTSNSSNGHSAVVDCYDMSGTRTTLTALSTARYKLAAATDGNGRILFGGGYFPNTHSELVDCYNASGTHTTLTPLSVARIESTAATDGNGRVLFGGGSNMDGDSVIVDCYDIPLDPYATVPVYKDTKYKFLEHNTEQIAAATGTITVERPNSGYIKVPTMEQII